MLENQGNCSRNFRILFNQYNTYMRKKWANKCMENSIASFSVVQGSTGTTVPVPGPGQYPGPGPGQKSTGIGTT